METDRALLAAEALKAKEKSYSPYSGFQVGAALLSEGGDIYSGCNIENAAYGPSNCAERTAFFKAVSEGIRNFRAIAISGGFPEKEPEYCYPCGVCRQVMAEFCNSDFEIIIVKNERDFCVHTLAELLPNRFGPDDLQ